MDYDDSARNEVIWSVLAAVIAQKLNKERTAIFSHVICLFKIIYAATNEENKHILKDHTKQGNLYIVFFSGLCFKTC